MRDVVRLGCVGVLAALIALLAAVWIRVGPVCVQPARLVGAAPAASAALVGAPADPAPFSPAPDPAPRAGCPDLLPLGAGEAAPAKALYVQKALRRVGYYRGGRLASRPDGAPGCFPVGLGFTPEGTKRREGDGRTPEGRYTVHHKNPQSRYHLSLGVSYPNAADAKAGLDAGIIDAATYARILRSPGWPPQDTAMGGAIYLHGGGGHADWTLGCVAVDNEAMDWLFAEGEVGMAVWIVP